MESCIKNADSSNIVSLSSNIVTALPGTKVSISAKVSIDNGQLPTFLFSTTSGTLVTTAVANEIDVIMPETNGPVTISVKMETQTVTANSSIVINVDSISGNSIPNEPTLVHSKQGPEINRFFPPNGANDIPEDSKIVVEFSEAMSMRSIMNAFTIAPKVDGIFYWSNSTCTFIPKEKLKTGSTYSIIISDNAYSEKGTYLREGKNWSFSVK